MINPWDLKVDDGRTSDNVYTFNIFCEGKVSEPAYFKWFETPNIKIVTHGDQKSMCKNINKTITKCIGDGILKEVGNGIYELYEEGMEIWCVFDRDKNRNESNIAEGNIDFNSAIVIAQNTPLKIAWSNDSFDLWILLHLEDVDPNLDVTKYRSYYFERLSRYFKSVENPSELLARTLSHGNFSYEKDFKQERKLRQIVIPEIISKTSIAIERARGLMLQHEKEASYALKSPCTNVFELVERLLTMGGKELK